MIDGLKNKDILTEEQQRLRNMELIGVKLTENLAMFPAASVSGYYFAHPQARYFGLGKITEDQIIDYARRKDTELISARKWLAPNTAEE